MGRYSSVQAYTDQQNARTTSYEQEKNSASSSSVKTEKVHNPYGSTAGAGSGDFHVYRHARAREQERMKALDVAEAEHKEEMEFQGKIRGWKDEEQKRLDKKRKKRAKGKAAKLRKKNLSLSGVAIHTDANDSKNQIDEDEFNYTPLHLKANKEEEEGPKEDQEVDKQTLNKNSGNGDSSASDSASIPHDDHNSKEDKKAAPLPFKNDGSFMEMMKKMQEKAKTKDNSVGQQKGTT